MATPRSKLVRAGLIVAFATVLVPMLWPVALVLAVLVLVRTEHQRQGAIILVLGVFVLPPAGAYLWQAFFIKPYRMPSESMLPTLKLGDRFLVWRPGYEPRVGDIAVFRAPIGSQEGQRCAGEPPRGQMCRRPLPGVAEGINFVKRVVAGPGDRISMRDGRIIRNGKPEPDVPLGKCRERAVCDFPKEITVPDGHWFVLGDNRGASDDSRFWGPVPTENFIGRKLFVYRNG